MHLPLPWAFRTTGDASGLWNMCRGKGKHVMTTYSRCQLLLPNSLDPWTAFNYPICAVLTVGSETQLWQANKRADLEKECLYSKGPGGFKGHYIEERLAGRKALAISSLPVFVRHKLLFWTSCAEMLAFIYEAVAVLQFSCLPKTLLFSVLNPDIIVVSEGLRGHLKTFEHPCGSHSH